MLYPRFDRSKLRLKSLKERKHLISLADFLSLEDPMEWIEDPRLDLLCRRVVEARRQNAAVILMMGAHVLRAGLSRLIIALMEQGWVSHVAMNGAGPIHDFEMALEGATTESVADYIRRGEFGLWEETGRINEILKAAQAQSLGFGESVGQAIQEGDFPHREISILAAGYRLKVPVTVHVGIGYDIIHQHPNCDGAATGQASYHDFLIFTESVHRLEGGVLLNFGSAVMGPEVYLKALSMVRNLASQAGCSISRFTTAVFDRIPLGDNLDCEPDPGDSRYYFRPFKTILVRTVRDGGESFYFCGDHRRTFPNLYLRLQQWKTTD